MADQNNVLNMQRIAELEALLREWLKKAEKFPELQEFRGGYRPFLSKATRAALSEAQPEVLNP